MAKRDAQLDLFAARPRSFDEAKLLARLKEVETAASWGSFLAVGRAGAEIARTTNRAQVRRLMTPLPRITAFD